MLSGRRAGGCKCGAANRLYVLSLTPDFLPPTKVFLLGESSRTTSFGEVQFVVCVCAALNHCFCRVTPLTPINKT